jgi:hypothetical protein
VERSERIERLGQFIAEGRIIRHKFHSQDDQGRATACLLAALGADINSPRDCPADVMPRWLAELTPSIDDCGSEAAWAWRAMIQRYGAAAKGWHVLDDAAWRRVRAKMIISALELILSLDRYGIVQAAIDLQKRVVAGEKPSPQEVVAVVNKAEDAYGADWNLLNDRIQAAVVAATEGEDETAINDVASARTFDQRSSLTDYVGTTWDHVTAGCLTAIEEEIARVNR